MNREWVGSKSFYILSAIFALLAIAGIVYVIVINIPKSAPEEIFSDYPESEEKDKYANRPKTLVTNNRYQLDYSLGKKNSIKVFGSLEQIFMLQKELETAPEPQASPDYVATLLETTFKKTSSPSNYAYEFQIEISDKRLYQVYATADIESKDYVITATKRIDGSSSKSYLHTRTNQASFKTMALDWAKQKLGTNDIEELE